MEKKRNHMLDVMKGICIIFIVITHFDWTDADRLKFGFPFWIDMAVPLFMIISGYAYSMSFQNHKIERFSEAFRLNDVLMKFIRYTVPFCIALLIEFAAIAIGSVVMPDVFSGWLPQGILSVFKITVTGGLGPGNYYYPIMVQFIFTFPIIYFIVKRYNTFGFILCILINVLYEIVQTGYGLNEETYRLLLFRYVMLIAFGVYFYLNKGRKFNPAFTIAFLFIGISYIVANKYLGWQPKSIPYWQGTSYLAAMFIIPIVNILLKKDFKFKPIELLGRASFEIFLTQMVYYTFGASLINKIIESDLIRFTISIVANLIFGTIFYLVEDPITRKVAKAVGAKVNELNVDGIESKLDAVAFK